jgi:Uma2 family endonuclease
MQDTPRGQKETTLVERPWPPAQGEWTIEILSPSNWLYDRREKMRVYQESGVPEYWIVDPRALTIEIYVLEQGVYQLAGEYDRGAVAASRLLSGFELPVDVIFA